MSNYIKYTLSLILIIFSFEIYAANPTQQAALVVFEYDFNSKREITCSIAKSSKEQYFKFFTSLKEEKRKPIETRMNQQLKECDYLTEVHKYTNPLLGSVNKGETDPEKLFIFLVTKLGSESVAGKGRQIGFFNSIEKCNYYKKRAKEINIATLECRNWKLNKQ